MEQTADIALIGLAVMGQNLILNMNDHGYTVVAFNRTMSKVDEFLNDAAKGRKTIIGAHSIEEMVGLLKRPRKVMLMVKAGKAVDDFIEQLLPHLEPGDLIIDGGNSHFPDTIRRTKYLESKGLLYIGTGVSGGEEGARFGPSMMPGGIPAAWPLVKDDLPGHLRQDAGGRALLRLDRRRRRGPLREDGAQRHRVRRHAADLRGLPAHEGRAGHDATRRCTTVFAEWNKGELDSYLIEITRDILALQRREGRLRSGQDPRHRRAEGHGQVDQR